MRERENVCVCMCVRGWKMNLFVCCLLFVFGGCTTCDIQNYFRQSVGK